MISHVEVGETTSPYSIDISDLGVPHKPLNINESKVTFGCQKRICQTSLHKRESKLLFGGQNTSNTSWPIQIRNSFFLAISINNRISLITL
jgi:hypothetical protein